MIIVKIIIRQVGFGRIIIRPYEDNAVDNTTGHFLQNPWSLAEKKARIYWIKLDLLRRVGETGKRQGQVRQG
jgi:hypothetical protein